MTLVAAAISGDEKRVLDFQKSLDLCLFQPGNNPLLNSMTFRFFFQFYSWCNKWKRDFDSLNEKN